jgi:hypothetical protein
MRNTPEKQGSHQTAYKPTYGLRSRVPENTDYEALIHEDSARVYGKKTLEVQGTWEGR